jgi:TM2 domain-containing membrane protein YozV
MNKILVAVLFTAFFSKTLSAQVRPLSALVKNTEKDQQSSVICMDMEQQPQEKKSVLLAVGASLLVPGLGELYVGSFESGKYHVIAEAGLWVTYAGFRTYSGWIRSDAHSFAVEHSGADFSGKDDQFDVNIGNFMSTADYNEAKTRNREYDLIYFGEAKSGYFWNWDSDADRLKFKDLRIKSDRVKNNSKFVVGVIVINHLISAFSAGRKAIAYNKSLSVLDKIQVHAYTINTGSHVDGAGLNISTSF